MKTRTEDLEVARVIVKATLDELVRRIVRDGVSLIVGVLRGPKAFTASERLVVALYGEGLDTKAIAKLCREAGRPCNVSAVLARARRKLKA